MATILVVDDKVTNQRLLAYTLQIHSHTVVTASNGYQALDRLEEVPCDLVFIDLMMPHMDGLTFLKHLRADARYRSLPVVILTASVREHDVQVARAAGVSEFLTKPASSEEVIDVVNRLLPDMPLLGAGQLIRLPSFP